MPSLGCACSQELDAEQWLEKWEIRATAEYIVRRGFKKVTLQLPDHLLQQAFRLSRSVQQACTERGSPVQVGRLGPAATGVPGAKWFASACGELFAWLTGSCIFISPLQCPGTNLQRGYLATIIACCGESRWPATFAKWMKRLA